MATLDKWLLYLKPPLTHNFSELRVVWHDAEPPILSGPGEVLVTGLSTFMFSFESPIAVVDPQGVEHWNDFALINPYNALAGLRLFGTDHEGRDWALGWIDGAPTKDAGGWHFSGALASGICPHVSGKADGVSDQSEAEVIYHILPAHPIAVLLKTSGAIDNTAGSFRRTVTVLNVDICIEYVPAFEALRIVVPHGPAFPPPFAENWVGEPLRVLFGVLLYPRLVARNLGAGESHVFIRPAFRLLPKDTWGAVLHSHMSLFDADTVWDWYTKLLGLIASARDANGSPNFEANVVTSFYVEIIQSARATRWVWALTISSCIERLVKMLKNLKERDPTLEDAGRVDLISKIEAMDANRRWKGIAKNALKTPPKRTIGSAMRELISEKVLTEEQRKAWEEIRHEVMHGNLIPNYSTEPGDRQISALLEAMRALTIAVLKAGPGALHELD